MKNIDKAKILEKIRKIFEDNNINITACGCCGGYHIEIDGDDICEGSDFINDSYNSIKYYKENQGKIYVHTFDNKFTKIEMIKLPSGEIVNLGGKSHPFTQFMQHYHKPFKDFYL